MNYHHREKTFIASRRLVLYVNAGLISFCNHYMMNHVKTIDNHHRRSNHEKNFSIFAKSASKRCEMNENLFHFFIKCNWRGAYNCCECWYLINVIKYLMSNESFFFCLATRKITSKRIFLLKLFFQSEWKSRKP